MTIVNVGYLYLGIQVTVSTLFYILGAFLDIPYWVALIMCLTVLSFGLIGVLLTDSYKEEVNKIEHETMVSTRFILDLRIDSATFARKYTEEIIRDVLLEFVELVKYSDPVSSDELIDIEDEIGKRYIEIKELVINSRFLEAKDKLKVLISIMEERNQRCKLLKK